MQRNGASLCRLKLRIETLKGRHFKFVCLTGVILAGVLCESGSAGQRVFDFSGLPSRSERDDSALGQFYGSRNDQFETDSDGNVLPYVRMPYILPLVVRIVSVAGPRVAGEPRVTVELFVKNAGTAPYWLPVSTDRERRAVLPGNKGRRQLLFDFKVQDPKAQRVQTIQGIFLEGSLTVPNSLLRLAPREFVVIRLDLYLASMPALTASETLNVRAIVTEQELADDRYLVWDYSTRVVSDPMWFRPVR